jgi:hypothetical protein
MASESGYCRVIVYKDLDIEALEKEISKLKSLGKSRCRDCEVRRRKYLKTLEEQLRRKTCVSLEHLKRLQ